MKRLLDKGPDIALLRELAIARADGHWVGQGVARDAANWLATKDMPALKRSHLMTGIMSTLGALVREGLVEAQDMPRDGGTIYRLRHSVNLRLLTGGLDPLRMSVEEARELDDHVRERVEYRPNHYRKARSHAAQCERALWQCPSPWAYAARIQTLA